ncbi:DUF4336 domain-containing protein [Pseudoalteromonas fenneropenaei]|uniref:DUF4336 domain-containing protein n=1 Tax=Pseudoalteromonas fenneropenaei TaxID=1737459 RepID=A0ABV7CJE0_9GAMM
MKELAQDIWYVDGEAVSFFGFPYSTRMVVVRLKNGQLWVHSPIRLSDEIKRQLAELGEVASLVAPNQLHHLFLPDWLQAYPKAVLYGTAGVAKKRPDLTFHHVFAAQEPSCWPSDLNMLLFTGSAVMEECVFLHQASGTLIVTDLIENFTPSQFPPVKRLVAKITGILAPNGKMPLDWRSSFMFKKALVRSHIAKLVAWQPKRIVMAHGEIVPNNATAFLQRSFSWADLSRCEVD